mgnify:CR=1 FL=1
MKLLQKIRIFHGLSSPRGRTWAPGVRFGHQTIRKQRSNMTNLVVTPGGVPGLSWAAPGLLLGCLGSLRALWLLLAAPGCVWASPVASLLEPRETMKMTSIMTNLAAQI